MVSFSKLVAIIASFQFTQAVYFLAEPDKWRCFKDTVVSNYTLEMEVQVLDEVVLDNIVEANNQLRLQGAQPNQGVRLRLTDSKEKQLFFGDVHPNVQYEYEVSEGGQFTLCVQLTEMAFSDDYQFVKTKVKFSGEFHRNRRIRQEKQKGMFEAAETNMVDGTLTEEGLFHVREQQYQQATTEGHYMPLFRRVEKIQTVLEDIINYQNYEREQENRFKDLQRQLYNSFFNMTLLELLIVCLTAGYSVWSLRKFFVKKAIY